MDSNGIAFYQQIIASSTGAMLTSLFTTPLDVVKVRLQSQVNRPQPAAVCTTYCTGLLDHVCVCQTSSIVQSTECAVAVQQRNLSPRFKGTFDTLLKISRQEGIQSLWAGLPPTLVMTVPSTVLYFTMYEYIKAHLQRTSYKDYSIVPIMAGATSRVCSVTLISPLELVRTKLQSEKLNYRYIRDAVAVTVKKEGILSLWRGWGPTILRDVPFSCVYWLNYETFKRWTLTRLRSKELPITWAFICGAGAGTIAAVTTLPFDVVKTHRQIELGQLLTTSAEAVPIQTSRSTFSLMFNLYRTKGLSSLFSGVAPRIAKVAPSCAIMISSYEYFRSYFRKQNVKKDLDHPPVDVFSSE